MIKYIVLCVVLILLLRGIIWISIVSIVWNIDVIKDNLGLIDVILLNIQNYSFYDYYLDDKSIGSYHYV